MAKKTQQNTTRLAVLQQSLFCLLTERFGHSEKPRSVQLRSDKPERIQRQRFQASTPANIPGWLRQRWQRGAGFRRWGLRGGLGWRRGGRRRYSWAQPKGFCLKGFILWLSTPLTSTSSLSSFRRRGRGLRWGHSARRWGGRRGGGRRGGEWRRGRGGPQRRGGWKRCDSKCCIQIARLT